jgi:hypothetical protein
MASTLVTQSQLAVITTSPLMFVIRTLSWLPSWVSSMSDASRSIWVARSIESLMIWGVRPVSSSMNTSSFGSPFGSVGSPSA